MPFEELLRELAELAGRELARRWLRQRGLAPPPEVDPGRHRADATKSKRRHPPPDPPNEASQS
jgi:hypothetical protein